MGELTPPQRETIHTYMLGERSLHDWHAYLTTDRQTGTSTSSFRTMGNRYGYTAGEVAWWAVAAEAVYVHANGLNEEIQDSIDYCMGLVVNDNVEIADIVREYKWALPDDLVEQLDWRRVDYLEED